MLVACFVPFPEVVGTVVVVIRWNPRLIAIVFQGLDIGGLTEIEPEACNQV